MDRNIVYPGQIPLETDLLGTNQKAMVAIGKLAAALFGTSGVVNGLVVAPNTPAAMNVVVSAGEIYQLQNLEATAYSSLPADTTNTCVKQGIQLGSIALGCAAPTTAGFSVNYLIEATYADADVVPVTLPYYNASNPTQAYSGPGNSGTAQATVRAGQVQIQAKAGIAATTGSQVTPAVDAGYIGLAVVTVANGQTTITAGNITALISSQVLPKSILQLITGSRQQRATASGQIVVPAGVTTMFLSGAASGAGGGGGASSMGGGGTGGGGGGGGGAGQSIVDVPYVVVPGSTITYTIGAAGNGGNAGFGGPGLSGQNGTAGGNTVISGPGFNGGVAVTLIGGTGGSGGGGNAAAGAGGPGGVGFPQGSDGNDGISPTGGVGASSPFGGGGGGGRSGTTNGLPGHAAAGFGGGGGGGGGGYGSGTAAAGGNGANGAPSFLLFRW